MDASRMSLSLPRCRCRAHSTLTDKVGRVKQCFKALLPMRIACVGMLTTGRTKRCASFRPWSGVQYTSGAAVLHQLLPALPDSFAHEQNAVTQRRDFLLLFEYDLLLVTGVHLQICASCFQIPDFLRHGIVDVDMDRAKLGILIGLWWGDLRIERVALVLRCLQDFQLSLRHIILYRHSLCCFLSFHQQHLILKLVVRRHRLCVLICG